MHFYRLLIEVSIEFATILVAAYGLLHQYRIIKRQREEIEQQKREIEKSRSETHERRKEIQEQKEEIHTLKQEKVLVNTEINELRDIKNIKSLKLVESTLRDLELPLCTVCKELLFLRLSTSFGNAIERLDLLPEKVGEMAAKRQVNIGLILKTLEKTIRLKLWQIPLENDRSEQQFIEQAIKAYSSLIPSMPDGEIKGAIDFCVDCCSNDSPVLKREAVRTLLPSLLVVSHGDQELVQVYKKFLDGFRGEYTDEDKMLLVAIFGGLDIAAKVDSGNIKDVWTLTFKVATTNVAWAWEGHSGANVGTFWCHAIEKRVRRVDAQEKEFLRKLTARYLLTPEAPSYRLSYHQLARLLGDYIRPSIDSKAPRFRIPDRAVVPKGAIFVEITIKEENSLSPMVAELVNFSIDDSNGRLRGRGGWAKAEVNESWPPVNFWREAIVTVLYPLGGRIRFDQAKVLGPIPEGADNNSYYGFRIQFGPSSPEEAIGPLKLPWDSWPKR